MRFALYRQDLGDYMRRWIFVHPFGTVRLHNILRGDEDPDPHDHPWWFVSIILWGSYKEEVYAGLVGGGARLVRYWKPQRWWPRHVHATRLHRLVLDGPVWTLVVTGPRRREWGFYTSSGWVPWRVYVSRKGGLDLAEYQATIDRIYR